MTELHRRTLFAPLDQLRVVFKDGVHFLVDGNLLSVEHAPASLVDDLPAQVAVRRDLPAELVDRRAADHVHTFHLGGFLDDLARVFQHLLGDPE